MDAFIERGTEEAILKMTNFTLQEFDHIYGQLRDHIAVCYNTGRGKKCCHTPMDMFFSFSWSVKLDDEALHFTYKYSCCI